MAVSTPISVSFKVGMSFLGSRKGLSGYATREEKPMEGGVDADG